jgi:hypothetical protein
MQPEVDDDEDDDEMALHLFARYGDAETLTEWHLVSQEIVDARGRLVLSFKVVPR